MAINDLNKTNTRLSSSEFRPLILDDEEDIQTQDIDTRIKDQEFKPQYIDVDKPKFVQPEQRSYYVAGNVANNEIHTTAQRPNEIEYEADVVDDEKKKDNYFGLSKLKTNKVDIVKNALKYVANRANPIKAVADDIGMLTGKSGEDVAMEGVRGFAGSTVDFASSMLRFFGQNYMYFKGYTQEQLDKIANLGNVVAGGDSFSEDIKQKYTDFYNRIDEQTKEFKDKTEKFLEYTGIAKTDKDGFIYDLVGGGASLMYAIGIAAITKSPAAAAEFFGAYQYQSLYEEGIEKGFSPIKARTIGVIGGAAEGALEMVGLHMLLETLVARKSFMKLLKAAATEFVQEASQQGAEELLAKFSGMREEGFLNILQNVGYAGLIGALIGGGSATVSNVFYKQISDSATKELISKGVNSDYAKQMVNSMLDYSVSPQVLNEMINILKDEQSPVTYKNADPRETYKETGEAIKKALDPQQKREIEIEFLDEKKKLTQKLADALINSGKVQNNDEAYRQAEAAVSFYDELAREAYNQENIRPSEYYKRFNVNAQSGNIEIDERNVDEDNPFVDVSFDPVDFDDQARAEYEAAMDAQQEEKDKLQKDFTMSLKDHAKFFRDIGIDAIRRPTPDGVGKDRWGEYKPLSPRIKNYFFSDDPTAMSWDDAEKLLAASSSKEKDLFAYLAQADETAKTYNQKEVFNKVLAKEKEAIKQQAIADGTFLKAPNGKDSNLPEQLWLIVRTKAFKNWFGDWLNDPVNASKVVDENGEPLVVYHGTANNFRVFDKNKSYQGLFWFSDDYNKVNAGYDGASGKGVVMSVFLNIKNPANWDLYDKYSPEELENMKYDGLLLKDGNETVAVAFDNKQIKSINNRGSFDRRNPDIYYQPAWHGGPRDFNIFDLAFALSGEGAMAHGYGVYLAGLRNIAEKYRQKLIEKRIFDYFANNGYEFAGIDEIEQIIDDGSLKIEDKEILEFINALREEDWLGFSNMYEAIRTALRYKENEKHFTFSERLKKAVDGVGQVFQVDIPENDVLLDEDKTFDEQPKKVQEALRKIAEYLANYKMIKTADGNYEVFAGDRYIDTYDNEEQAKQAVEENNKAISESLEFDKNPKGRRIYDNISYQFISYGKEDDKRASLLLNKYGIKGITYDGYEDGKAYVIFDDKAVKILEKFYQPGVNNNPDGYLQEEQYFANIIQKYNPNIPKDDLYDDAKGVQLTFDFEQQANRETVESDVDKNVTDNVTQQETLTTIGNGASYAIWRNGKTGNRLDKLDSVSDIRRIKDSFVGLSITETLIHNGQFSLEGKVVHNPYELAVAAQVLRNPQFETIHAVFVKNDEIVYHFASTTRLAGATQFDIKGMDDLISKTDCDGFYLIHNHPNGDPKPSFADTIFTQQLAKRYGSKFKQHIVIDHNKYRTIDKDGVMSDTDLIIDSTKRDNLLKTSKKHKSLYKKIDPETLPMFAVDLQYGDGKSVVVYVTNKLQAKAIQVVDNSIFDNIDTALEYLSKSGDYAGSGRMFVITDSTDVNKQAKLIRKEYTREDKLAGILDVIYSKTKLNKDMVDNKQYESAYDIDRGYFSGRYNNKFFGERKYLYSGRLQNKKSLLKPTFDRDKLIENLSTDILSINPATSYSSLRKLVVAIENFINEKNSKAKDGYKKEINSIYKKENIEQNKTDKVIDRYTELFQQLNDKQGVVLREGAANYFQGNDNPRGATTVYDRQYFIDLFSGSDKSTLLHETGHVFLSEILYFARSKNASKKVLEIKKRLDEWLGEPEDNGRYSTRQQELFATSAEAFFREGKAPTAKLKTVFERFKKWLSDIYDRIKDDLPNISNDVRELFDTILSRSYNVPDSNIYAGKEAAIKEVIKNIQEGRASEVDGITIDDVYNLLNMAYTRKPSRPSKNLKQLLNDKNIYDFNELNKAGADTVLQILKDGGYVKEDATAEAAVELAKKALDGNPVYRLSDQWRVAGDIDFVRNLRVLEKVIEFSQIDSTLEKILSLQQEGYRNVEQSDVDKVQDEYKRLMSADVKEAKKIVEDIINRLHKKRFIDRAAQKQMIVDLNFSSTVEEIRESVLNVIEDLQDEIKLVKEQLKNPRKPVVRKDKTIPPGKNATEEEKNTYKKYMRKLINRLLKQALPRKQNQQKFSKFDVETQRFFTDLEKYNKMTIEQAQEELYKRATGIIDDEGVGLNNYEKMKNMFLSYKANKINQNTTEFYKQLYDNLMQINVFGRNTKEIEETLKKEQIQKDINSLVVNIEDNKSKGLATGVKKQYIKWLGNWWSTINAIAGKKQADKDSLERIEIDIFNKNYETTENLKTKCAAALGLKNATDLDMTVNRYLNEEYTYEELDARSGTRNAVKLNKMQLICCYIWMKNETLRERIVRAYGNEQIMDMMTKLTIQDKKFGDELQQSVAALYDDVNTVYLKMYGLDMPQAQNYFPSSTERIQGNMDLLKDNIGQVSSPGFIKARVQSNLPLMNFGNPVKIALDHIAKVNHFIYMQEKLADLNKVYKTTVVKRHITNAYGDRVYAYILQVLDNAKFTTVARTIDGISDVGDYLVNNYVLTKIAVKPSIMIKQLLSCINYAEDMSSVKWFGGFLKGVASPKKVIDFMMKNSKYCQSRFAKGGQTEALLKAMEGSNATFAKVKTFKGMLSWMTRVGDIGAIMFGGYPLVMDQMSKGVPLKTAIENFERATIRSQQASLPSTLSNFQYRGMNSWLYRAMFAFANTPNQYSRKIGDTMYMYFHGDIDKKQFAKNLIIYGVLNSFLYTSFTSLAILSGLVSGDWDDLKDDAIMALLQTSNILALPIISQAYNSFVSKVVTGDFLPDKEIPLLDDMVKIMRTATKDELETKDWLTIVDEVASLVLGVPVKTLYNEFVGSTKSLLDGEYGKFAVKLYGATESRANKIFD